MNLITICYRAQLCSIEGFTNKCHILKIFISVILICNLM